MLLDKKNVQIEYMTMSYRYINHAKEVFTSIS